MGSVEDATYLSFAKYARGCLTVLCSPLEPTVHESLDEDVVDGHAMLRRFLELPGGDTQFAALDARFRDAFEGYNACPRSEHRRLSEKAQDLAALIEPFAKKLAKTRYPSGEQWKEAWDRVVPTLLDLSDADRAATVRAAKNRQPPATFDAGAMLFAFIYPWRHRRAHEAYVLAEVQANELARASLALMIVLVQRRSNKEAIAAWLRIGDASEADVGYSVRSVRLRQEAVALAMEYVACDKMLAAPVAKLVAAALERNEAAPDISVLPIGPMEGVSTKQRGLLVRSARAQVALLGEILHIANADLIEWRGENGEALAVLALASEERNATLALLTAHRQNRRPSVTAPINQPGQIVVGFQTGRVFGKKHDDLLVRLLHLPHTEVGLLLDGEDLRGGRLDVKHEFCGDHRVAMSSDGEIWVSHCCYDERQHVVIERWGWSGTHMVRRGTQPGYRWGKPDTFAAESPEDALLGWLAALSLDLLEEASALSTEEIRTHLAEFLAEGPPASFRMDIATRCEVQNGAVTLEFRRSAQTQAAATFAGIYGLLATDGEWRVASVPERLMKAAKRRR